MSKFDFCICGNKGADQRRSNSKADQRLLFTLQDVLIRANWGHTRYLHSIYCNKMKNNCDLLFLFFILCMIIKFEINKLICILFVHTSIIPENFLRILF